MVTFCSVNFKENDSLVETSVDGRILIGLNEVGCECAGKICLFQCNEKWWAFMLLAEGRTNTDVVRSTASSQAIKSALCMLQIV